VTRRLGITRATVARLFALTVTIGVAAAQWFWTSPGEITDAEFHVLLLVDAIAVTVTLCASWVERGGRNLDTDRDTYAESDNQRVIRPPWS
jgi:hypothetical protein